MDEYIKREAVLRAVQGQRSPCRSPAQNRMLDCLKADVIRISAADVAPVVHGRWGTARFNLETGNYEKQCTRCRNFSKEHGKPYCPNCGAKMDGGAE